MKSAILTKITKNANSIWKSRCLKSEIMNEALEAVEKDLLSKKDCSEYICLIEECLKSSDASVRRKASWCLAKMGQNKTQNADVYELLLNLPCGDDSEIKENMLWGIGEIAGAGIGDERSVLVICHGLSDENPRIRGMAAWAAERIMSRLGMFSDELSEKLHELKNDPSPYVRKSVSFADEYLKKRL